MFNKVILPGLALFGIAFAVYFVTQRQPSPPPSRPLVQPPVYPTEYTKSIAGAGLIESRYENIPIGSPVPGVVTEVLVKKDQDVTTGTPLFRIDSRELEAELRVREVEVKSTQAELARIEAAPTLGDLPTAQAAVDEAQAKADDASIKLERSESLYRRNAGTKSDYDRDRYALDAARAALARAKADLERIRTTWAKDIEVTRARVAEAESAVERVKVEIDRRTVRALADGKVLQLNVRPGQFAALVWNEPLLVLGDTRKLHVRVDIDEQDLAWFKAGAPAKATLKGRPGVSFPLEFVRVEPYVIPKRSLTGDNAERVDTRVLQVVYALPDERPVDLYVGMQMDAYIEAGKTPAGLNLDYKGEDLKPFGDPDQGEAKPETPSVPLAASEAPAKGL